MDIFVCKASLRVKEESTFDEESPFVMCSKLSLLQ